MAEMTYLSGQLRESAPYLRDAGWRESADLMLAAAAEIEALTARLREGGSNVVTLDAAARRRRA